MAGEKRVERRKHKRVDLRLLLEFEDPQADPSEDRARMETLNFSAGGFYCRFNRETPPLTKLALRFVFPPFGKEHAAERGVGCEAIVVRCEPDEEESDTYQVAACFTGMAPEDRAFIQEYLDWHETVYCEEDELETTAFSQEEDVA